MIEKTIYLNGTDPLIFFGPNNLYLEILKGFFPKIKLIARGEQIKAIGTKSEVETFDKKINQVLDHINKYNSLSEAKLNEILNDTENPSNNEFSSDKDVLIFGNGGKAIRARNFHQAEMVKKFFSHDLMIATGPAGSGKTYMAVALAVRALRNKEVRRIILSRPAVESGEQLGFLPGDLKEKLDPYLQPLYDALLDMMPAKKLNVLLDENVIQIAPLAFMRGRTLENSFVILDEAQNATIGQLKMFLTRMGEYSKFTVTGDITQIDLPQKQPSGLVHAKKILGHIKGIAFIEFDNKDIIRHKLVERIVRAYDEQDLSPKKA